MAITMILGVFAIAVPVLAYICGGFLKVHEAPAPKIAAFIIATPWLPLIIAVPLAVALILKEQRLRSASATKVNVAAIAITMIVGGLTLFIVVLPMVQLLRALGA